MTTVAASADLSISKSDGVTSVTPGGTLTYTVVVANAGPSAAAGAVVTDAIPAALTCSWTSVASGGATGNPASGSGSISNTLNLPVGGSVTYTLACQVSAGASGTLTNTATVTPPAGVTDPNPGNDSATDADTIAAVVQQVPTLPAAGMLLMGALLAVTGLAVRRFRA